MTILLQRRGYDSLSLVGVSEWMHIGKVVASHAAVARSSPAEVALIYTIWTRRSGGTAHEGRGCDQTIGSTVSDAIVRSYVWLTATRSSPLGCFSTLLQVVDICPHILW